MFHYVHTAEETYYPIDVKFETTAQVVEVCQHPISAAMPEILSVTGFEVTAVLRFNENSQAILRSLVNCSSTLSKDFVLSHTHYSQELCIEPQIRLLFHTENGWLKTKLFPTMVKHIREIAEGSLRMQGYVSVKTLPTAHFSV